MNTISNRLRDVRAQFGKNQDEMAAMLGLGEASWKRLELEGRLPKGHVLQSLCGLGINMNWLIGGLGPMTWGTDGMPDTPEADALPSGRISIDLTISGEDIALIAKGIKALAQAGKAATPESEGATRPLLNGNDPEDLLVSAITYHVLRRRGYEEDALDVIRQLNIPLTVNRLAAVRACILLRRPA